MLDFLDSLRRTGTLPVVVEKTQATLMRITPNLDVARTDLAETGGYLLVLTAPNRALLDRQGAAIERRWHGLPVYAICNREQALTLGRSPSRLDAMDAAKVRDETQYARKKEPEQTAAAR